MPKKPHDYDPASLAERGIALLGEAHKLKNPVLVDRAQAVHPTTRKRVHEFTAVSAANANGPSYKIILDDEGGRVERTPDLDALFDRAAAVGRPVEIRPGIRPAVAGVTIQPTTNVLTLDPGDSFTETITVTIPKNSTVAKADVYFLADTTASMGGILNAVKAGANNILTALSGLGLDMVFGVGNYKDFPSDPFAFQHQLSPTNVVPTVIAAINTWSPAGGGDLPEAQLFALDSLSVPPGGSISWRAGSKRIIVWFGDVAGHDPICAAISGKPAAITEATVTSKLTNEKITILAISTQNPGLDGDPKANATDYTAQCGAPGGLPGQGTRLANATGGTFVTGINPSNVVNTIISLVKAAVSSINNVKLVPSPPIAPFVTSITPAGGYGPLPGDQEHVLKFEVTFSGAVPCKSEAQVFTGTLDVAADGVVVAAKRVHITVPACRFHYSVKFVCGYQPDCPCDDPSVRPGHYATDINIYNYSGKEIKIRKRIIPVVFAGAAVGREPGVARARAEDSIALPPRTATMDDCCRIAELLFGGAAPSPMPLTIGFLEIVATGDVAVTAVYTASDLKSGSVSIDVGQIKGRQL